MIIKWYTPREGSYGSQTVQFYKRKATGLSPGTYKELKAFSDNPLCKFTQPVRLLYYQKITLCNLC